MSTTFGIPQRKVDLDKLVDENGELLDYINTSFFEKIFFRSMNNSRWMNAIAELLPEDTRVFPLDNSAQGIYTIGDIKKYLQSEHDK
jgi:hypothetical protein